MRVCLTPLFKMWLVRLLDGNIISFYPLWNMSDVSSFIESTWQQISLDDTWSHYQEHQDQTSREKLHTRVVFPFGQGWNLLSTPEDLCCYHQTWTSGERKKKKKQAHICYNICQANMLNYIKKKKKSTGVAYAHAQTIIFRSFMRFYLILSASLSHTSYNNGVCARTQTMAVNECCKHINLIWYNLSYTNTHTGPTK